MMEEFIGTKQKELGKNKYKEAGKIITNLFSVLKKLANSQDLSVDLKGLIVDLKDWLQDRWNGAYKQARALMVEFLEKVPQLPLAEQTDYQRRAEILDLKFVLKQLAEQYNVPNQLLMRILSFY